MTSPTLDTLSNPLGVLGAAPWQSPVVDDDNLRREVLPHLVLPDELAGQPGPQDLDTGRGGRVCIVLGLKEKYLSEAGGGPAWSCRKSRDDLTCVL